MAEIKLSILIPITESRRNMFERLRLNLVKQTKGKPVEILLNWNEKDNVGRKRNILLSSASGEYVWYVDSDDAVAEDAVDKILAAIESKPDCVGISGWITTNGKHKQQWHISREYEGWSERDGIFYRTPNHISPVRTEIARKVGFPEISHGEDAIYSRGLIRLLKTEVKIEGDIYFYRYRTNKV